MKARSSQNNPALDFLSELTQHVPNKGEHLVRYYGWYSHRQRGIPQKSPLSLRRGAGGEGRDLPRPLGEGQGVRAVLPSTPLSTARLRTP